MKKALDNIEQISTGNLKQRQHELISEFALVSRDNKTTRIAIATDYVAIAKELSIR